jgi:hypothetical protein
MSIPLDRLYHHIENIAKEIYNDDVLIYRFFPHGSKNIADLNLINDHSWEEITSWLPIYCYDQEPLNFDLYENLYKPPIKPSGIDDRWVNLLSTYFDNENIKKEPNIFDRSILLHSEQRSAQLNKYQQNHFIPAYFWSHAVIALDWFRYAQHVKFKKQTKKIFLIYNRAWSGTREYRLKFMEYLINKKLITDCDCSLNPVEPDLNLHYSQYKFNNVAWQPTIEIENYFLSTSASGNSSADFDINDYNSTDIEVVLETLFDDERLHLTEKSLRPLACKQPFILVGTQGSLEYLRNYGFKTFGDIWDESYDQERDHQARLSAIATLMKTISDWDHQTRIDKLAQACEIAEYNHRHFFSQEFFNTVISELKSNLGQAITELVDTNTSSQYLNRVDQWWQIDELKKIMSGKASHPMSSVIPENSRFKLDFWNSDALSRIISKAQQYYLKNTQK